MAPARSKRELASAALATLGLTTTLGTLRSAFVQDLRVLAYHRVLPALDEEGFAFDVELVSAVQEAFDQQMAWLAERYEPVSCRQVADALRSGMRLPKRAVMVTFDDGFRDNYEVAFPILRRHGVPALFFLSTGYIGTDRVFWFDWLVHVLLRTRAQRIRLDELDLTIHPGASLASRRAEARKLLGALKRIAEPRRVRALEQLDREAAVELAPADRALSAAMNWDQVREMSRAGMEFGSHTVTHPILARVEDAAALRFELEASRATIERETGVPVLSLAYPVGGRDAVDSRVLEAVAAAGYEFAFTYQSGVNRLGTGERFMLRRLHVEPCVARDLFRAMLELPEVFAW